MWFIERQITVKGKKRKIYKYNEYSDVHRYSKDLYSYLSRQSFREKKSNSVRQVTKVIRGNIKNGYKKIYIADISKFFDTISHDLLLENLKSKMEKKYFNYLEQMLSQFALVVGKQIGLPTGINIANLLSELYLIDLDKKMIKMASDSNFYYSRYVDNFIFMFKTDNAVQSEVGEVLANFENLIKSKNLKLNYVKVVGFAKDIKNFQNFTFLGFEHKEFKVALPKDSIKQFKNIVFNYLRRAKKDEKECKSHDELRSVYFRLVFLINRLIVGHCLSDYKVKSSEKVQKRWVGFSKYLSVVDSFEEVKDLSKWIRQVVYSFFGKFVSDEICSLTKWYFLYKKNLHLADIKAEKFATNNSYGNLKFDTKKEEKNENDGEIFDTSDSSDYTKNPIEDAEYHYPDYSEAEGNAEIASIFGDIEDMDGDQRESFGHVFDVPY